MAQKLLQMCVLIQTCLCCFVQYMRRGWWEAEVYIEDFKREKNMISIRQTVEKYSHFVNSLIPVHALTGCDTMPMFGIGKTKSENIVSKQPFKFLGQTNADITSVLHEGKSLVAQCYGLNETDSSKNRFVYKIFNLGLKIVIGAEGFILNV